MYRTLLLIICIGLSFSVFGADAQYTLTFGSSTPGTTSLTNANFCTAVSGGQSLIAGVTSVVAVFPETDCIRMSSNKTNGKFNIALTEDAQVVAKRIEIIAARYDNDRDADALLMVNSEPLEIISPSPEKYTITLPSRPGRALTNLIVDAERRVYIYSISVIYDSSQGEVPEPQETVTAPEFIPGGGQIAVGTRIALTCPTPDATIYFTTDGTEPTTASGTIYEAPITIYNDMTLNAFAVKEGMDASAISTAKYTVHNPGAELTGIFDFNHPETLTPSTAAPAVKEWIDLDGRTYTDGDVAVTFAATAPGNTNVRLYGSYDAGTDLRLYDGDKMTIRSMNSNYVVTEATFVTSLSGGQADVDFEASAGQYEWLTNTWTADKSEGVEMVELTSRLQSRISSMQVKLEALSGLRSIDAPKETETIYYNLQGHKINNPNATPGIYIRLSERDAQKVIIR